MIVDIHLHLTEPVELILDEMDRWGVDRGVLCPSGLARGERMVDLSSARDLMSSIGRSREPGGLYPAATVSAWNRATAAAVRQYPHRLEGFGKIDLRFDEPTIADHMEEALSLGLRGFGEILGCETMGERARFVVATSDSLGGFPVFFHGDYPTTAETIRSIATMAAAFPRTPVILGHLGGDFWIDAVSAAKETPNLYLDTSEAVNLAALRVAVAELPDRVCFGSDFPWETMGVGLTRARALGLDVGAADALLGGNAETLLWGHPSVGQGASR